MEDLHCLLALGELEVLVEIVEELVELLEKLVNAHVLDKSSLELHREALLVAHARVGCAWLRLDLNIGGLVAPQVLDHLAIVALDVVPRHLVLLGVVVLVQR